MNDDAVAKQTGLDWFFGFSPGQTDFGAMPDLPFAPSHYTSASLHTSATAAALTTCCGPGPVSCTVGSRPRERQVTRGRGWAGGYSRRATTSDSATMKKRTEFERVLGISRRRAAASASSSSLFDRPQLLDHQRHVLYSPRTPGAEERRSN
jgi:hypothetical protein